MPSCGKCYSAGMAGSSVCREARGGTCVRYAEEVRAETKGQLNAGACEEVTGNEPNTCKTCGAVIGSTKYCSACNDSGSTAAPTDGVCTADNAVCSTKLDGVCTTCKGDSFMFKGGCYRTEQDPGQTMCTQAANGICGTAADGNAYFIPLNADASHDSVVACNDTAEITLTNKKKYVGVANCKTCNAPSQASGDTAEAATCTACEDGYFVNNNACTACQDDNCATCAATGNNKCSTCKMTGTKTYLKTESSSPTGTCVEVSQCGPAAFPKNDAESGNKCVPSNDGTNGGLEHCGECSLLPSASRAGAILITCTKCSSNNLSPLKN